MRTIPEVSEEIKKILNDVEHTQECDGETLVTIDELVNEILTINSLNPPCYLGGPCEYQSETANINHGWIPCNKELPKEIMQDCLVTLKNGAVLQAMYSQVTNEFKMVCLHDVTTFPDDNPVIAWRPMLSGYEPIDENEI